MRQMTREAAIQAIRQIGDAIVETVREAGPAGAPASSVYLALQEQGATFADCEHIIGTLVAAGRLRRTGDLLFAPEGGGR